MNDLYILQNLYAVPKSQRDRKMKHWSFKLKVPKLWLQKLVANRSLATLLAT